MAFRSFVHPLIIFSALYVSIYIHIWITTKPSQNARTYSLNLKSGSFSGKYLLIGSLQITVQFGAEVSRIYCQVVGGMDDEEEKEETEVALPR